MSLPTPPRVLGALSDAEMAAVLAAVRAGEPGGFVWLDKVRRFVSLHGRNLGPEVGRRFGAQAEQGLAWLAEVCLAGGCLEAVRRAAPIDAACLNGALYCIDRLGTRADLREQGQRHVEALQQWLVATTPQAPASPPMGPLFSYRPRLWRTEAAEAGGIAIICPSPYSLFTASTFAICRMLGVEVRGVLVRKFTVSRFRQEWHRDGARLLAKVWRKLVLRGDENAAAARVSLKSLAAELLPSSPNIRKLAAAARVPVIEVDEFDMGAPSVAQLAADVAIFTGGGMVRQPLLDAVRLGVINVHMGPLPQYKGMDVVQAPILDGAFDSIALTAHLMETRLDRGPVLGRFEVGSDAYGSLGSLRNELSAVMPLLAIDSALGLMSGRLTPIEQPDAGRQYYFVHPTLEAVLARVMAGRRARLPAGAAPELIGDEVARFVADVRARSLPAAAAPAQ